MCCIESSHLYLSLSVSLVSIVHISIQWVRTLCLQKVQWCTIITVWRHSVLECFTSCSAFISAFLCESASQSAQPRVCYLWQTFYFTSDTQACSLATQSCLAGGLFVHTDWLTTKTLTHLHTDWGNGLSTELAILMNTSCLAKSFLFAADVLLFTSLCFHWWIPGEMTLNLRPHFCFIHILKSLNLLAAPVLNHQGDGKIQSVCLSSNSPTCSHSNSGKAMHVEKSVVLLHVILFDSCKDRIRFS